MTRRKSKIGYKCVREWNGKWYSVAVTKPAKVEYHLNMETVPNQPFGPLCVFKSLRTAEFFRQNIIFYPKDKIILKVKYIPSNQEIVWDNVSTDKLQSLPEGTILADSVTPIKVIK